MQRMMPAQPDRPLRPKGRRGRFKGIDLIEVVVILVVLGLLVSVIVVAQMNGYDNAMVSTMRLKLKSVENAVRRYSKKNGYPSQDEGLGVLVNPPGGQKPYLLEMPKDAWNHDLLYFNPASRGPQPFEVISMGPDGKEGTDDDIHLKKKKKARQSHRDRPAE